MVARKVRENTTSKFKTADAFLMNGMGTALHESVVTARCHHTRKQLVQRDRVGRRMVRGNRLAVDIIADRRAESTLITELSEESIEQRSYRRFPVRSRHSHQFQVT